MCRIIPPVFYDNFVRIGDIAMALTLCGTKTNRQGMELARHGTGLFPVACYCEDLSREPVPWHWHCELEAGVILRGRAVVCAGTERFTLGPGEGFFINSEVLHALWSQDGSPCLLHSAVFHPRLIGGSADSIFWQNYVGPLIGDGARQSVRFDGAEPWHEQAAQAVETAWRGCAEEQPGYDLQVREALSRLAFLLSRNRPAKAECPPEKVLRNEARVKRMLRFIEDNYDSPLTTADIADSAMISESECLRCFRSTIGVPPTQYLKQFRVQKAAELLLSSGESVGEIGARCGFPDASYFTKTFRELKGCTPSAYRKSSPDVPLSPAGEK